MMQKSKRPSNKLIARFQHQLNRLNSSLETLASQHPELSHLQTPQTRAEQAPEVDRLLHGTAMLMADVAVSIDEHLAQAGIRLLAMKNPDLTFWCPKSKVTPWPDSLKNNPHLAAASQLQIHDGLAPEKIFSSSWAFHRQGVKILAAEIQVCGSSSLSALTSSQTSATHHLILTVRTEKPEALTNTFCCHIQGLSLFAWELWAGIQQAFDRQQNQAESKVFESMATPCGLGSETHHLLWPRATKTPWGGALLEDFFNCPESLRLFKFTFPPANLNNPIRTLAIPLLLSNTCQLLTLNQGELLALLLPEPVLWCNVFTKALKPVAIETSTRVHHIEPQGAYKTQQRIMRIEHISQEAPHAGSTVAAQSFSFHHEETWHQSSTSHGAFLMLHQTLPVGQKLSIDALCTETKAKPQEAQTLKAFALLQAQAHKLASICKLEVSEFVELLLLYDHTEQNTWRNLRSAFVSLKVESQCLQIRQKACFTPMSAHCFKLGLLPEKLLPIPVSALGYVIERWLAGFCSTFEMVCIQMTHALNPARVLYEGSWKISPTQNVFCSAPGLNPQPHS